MDSKLDKHIKTIVFAIVICAVCAMGVLGALSVLHVLPSPLSDDNLTIVLSFVGVIATFIVVGNYAQVSGIRDDMSQKMEEYKKTEKESRDTLKSYLLEEIKKAKEIDSEERVRLRAELTTNFQRKLEEVCQECSETHVKPLKEELDDVNQRVISQSETSLQYFSSQTKDISFYIRSIVEIMVNTALNEKLVQIAVKVVDANSDYKILCKKKKRSISAKAKIDHGILQFYSVKNSIMTNIASGDINIIDGITIEDFTLLSRVAVLFVKLQEKESINDSLLSSLQREKTVNTPPLDGEFYQDKNKI